MKQIEVVAAIIQKKIGFSLLKEGMAFHRTVSCSDRAELCMRQLLEKFE